VDQVLHLLLGGAAGLGDLLLGLCALLVGLFGRQPEDLRQAAADLLVGRLGAGAGAGLGELAVGLEGRGPRLLELGLRGRQLFFEIPDPHGRPGHELLDLGPAVAANGNVERFFVGGTCGHEGGSVLVHWPSRDGSGGKGQGTQGAGNRDAPGRAHCHRGAPRVRAELFP
jgi:hypothetical protein